MTGIGRFLLLGLVLVCGGALSQAARDPTVAPLAATPGAAGHAGAATASLSDAGQQPFSVIVRDGHPYLIVGTRLYAQGQKFGEARIERITETQVWLREGKTLRKLERFSGVKRQAAGAPSPDLRKP